MGPDDQLNGHLEGEEPTSTSLDMAHFLIIAL